MAVCTLPAGEMGKRGALSLTCSELPAVASGTNYGVHRGHFQIADLLELGATAPVNAEI